MFIKWVKTSEWWQMWGDVIKGVCWFWVFMSWLFWFVDMLPNNSEMSEVGKFLHYKLVPFMLITGVLPSLCLFVWRGCERVRDLYLDYQYFAANGGKRKNDDKQ